MTIQVDSVDENGALLQRPAAACGFVYRGLRRCPGGVYRCRPPACRRGRASEIEQVVRSLRDRRREREPHGFPTPAASSRTRRAILPVG